MKSKAKKSPGKPGKVVSANSLGSRELLDLNPCGLKPHPLLERVPMREALSKLMAKDRDHKEAAAEEAEDWRAFCADVKAHGVQEPIRAALIGGEWLIVDGRHRWQAALAGELATVPVAQVPGEHAADIILGAIAHRRHLPKSATAYLAVMLHPHIATEAERGKPSAEKLAEGKVTRAALAERTGISMALLEDAVRTWRHFEDKPAQRKKLEPLVLSGHVSLGAARAGASGGAATKDKARPEVDYFAPWRKTLNKLTIGLSDWDKWKPEEKEEAVRVAALAPGAWPEEIRAAVLKSLTGEGAV